ncbi:hypothetical protein EUX98_g5467 [Antrodiella citrinella]|uniref:DUF6535 domain-containing protein n=1 Tax=Antrodiella citrinella TaxID=2447956 RepID=A0A4S4MSC5_9APHY|nr:hypothetical protein EUX98_g5467 [Antrodiella citrinella]
MSISTLSPDPNVTTQALLQAIALSLSNSTSSSSPTLQLAVWNGPGTTVIWVQSLLYASLACSLFAALGAVMGKQWLNRYSSIGERGTIADRCKDRQRKLEGLQVWHFRTVLELLPILLQASLLLFGTSICGYMWSQQRTVGAVLIVANSIGALFYFSVIILSLLYPNCPFYSPLSDMLRRFVSIFPYTYVVDLLSSHYSRLIRSDGWISVVDGWTKLLRVASGSSKQCTLLAKRILTRLRRVFTRTYGTHATPGDQEMAIQQPDDDDPAPSLLDLNRPMESIADNSARPGLSEGSIAPHSVVLHKLVEAFRAVTRLRSVDGTEEPRSVDMAVVLWLLQTSTDPNVHADALQVIPEISWPRSTLTSLLSWSMVDLLLANLAACFQPDGHGKLRLNSSSKENVLAIGSAFLFVYWEKHVNDTNTAETVAWTHRAGRPFVQKHADMIDALRDLTRSDDYVRHEERQIICLVYLTIGPGWGKRYTPGLPGYSPMSTTTEALCARTILYLAQVSHAEQWDATSDILLLLDALGGCRNYATSDEFRNMSLMAMGMMLGFRRGNQILSSDM